MRKFLVLISCLLATVTSFAEDGHQLWLRMQKQEKAASVTVKNGDKKNATQAIALQEIRDYWKGGEPVILNLQPTDGVQHDDYTISHTESGYELTATNQKALLYATYDLLRRQQTGQLPGAGENIQERPSYMLRILNHWDNPNLTMERGYSGKSIWKWEQIPAGKKEKMPENLAQLYREYARANASIGINATVLNNVNAKPLMLSSEQIAKTAKIADILRPYGIRVSLAVNFASPKAIGGLPTADPLDPEVNKWWEAKAKEIYSAIPDFLGFLVKANSEGEPGPMDYQRTHADGANMLARAVKPFGGIIMWRSFVYASNSDDRANQAQLEFLPFDGKFESNVIIQVKNGPIDFQPREPVSPLFFALKKTATMPEFQITQEYTGHSVHTCFLAPMWTEFFKTAPAAPKFNGTAEEYKHYVPLSLIAGVANIGDDRNWTGNDLAQANWYAYGRLAWNTSLTSMDIAREFLAQTYSTDPTFLNHMSQLLVRTREAVVSYMMPLGLHHIFAGGHHYGPEPWYAPRGSREDWLPRYYHRADAEGLGFNRTDRGGSKNTRQYPDQLYTLYNNIETCPEDLILWFHHVPWQYVMRNGLTMWDNLCYKYDEGMTLAESFVKTWEQMRPYVDAERYASQLARFKRQARDAQWWHDACLLYFQTFNKLPFPADMRPCIFKLEDLMKYHLNIDNYTAAPMDKLP